METDQAKLQEYWDMCLIKHWRQFGKVSEAADQFKAITGRDVLDCGLKRAPSQSFPQKLQMRVFVDAFLPKIADRLNEQSEEKDLALWKKLQSSKYDTLKRAMARDRSIQRASHSIKKANERIYFEKTQYLTRNHDTDWNVTKASVKRTR